MLDRIRHWFGVQSPHQQAPVADNGHQRELGLDPNTKNNQCPSCKVFVCTFEYALSAYVLVQPFKTDSHIKTLSKVHRISTTFVCCFLASAFFVLATCHLFDVDPLLYTTDRKSVQRRRD